MITSKFLTVSALRISVESSSNYNTKLYLGAATWRMATSFTVMNVKGSTKEAKEAAYMSLVHHYFVYMIMYRLVTVKDSMITQRFVDKLAKVKTSDQMEELVLDLMENQFPKVVKKGWNIPKLEEMEAEITHLISYWNDKRVSVDIASKLSLY